MKKYAFANVKIPLEILSNGNFELLKEHIQVEFTQCKELPPKQELNIDFSSILNDLFKQEKINMNIEKQEEREIKIKEFTEEREREEEAIIEKEAYNEPEQMVILASEIKNIKTQKKNTSFKHRKSSHNFTNKIYL
jgi:hypothetical protein